MPQTKTQRNSAPPKAPATRKPRAGASKPGASRSKPGANGGKVHEPARPIERTTELSEEVLKSLETGQRAAIDAVRKFVDTVNESLPTLGERPSKRQDIIDAAMEMADRLVHTQYDFLRNVVQSAGKALGRPGDRA